MNAVGNAKIFRTKFYQKIPKLSLQKFSVLQWGLHGLVWENTDKTFLIMHTKRAKFYSQFMQCVSYSFSVGYAGGGPLFQYAGVQAPFFPVIAVNMLIFSMLLCIRSPREITQTQPGFRESLELLKNRKILAGLGKWAAFSNDFLLGSSELLLSKLLCITLCRSRSQIAQLWNYVKRHCLSAEAKNRVFFLSIFLCHTNSP